MKLDRTKQHAGVHSHAEIVRRGATDRVDALNGHPAGTYAQHAQLEFVVQHLARAKWHGRRSGAFERGGQLNPRDRPVLSRSSRGEQSA